MRLAMPTPNFSEPDFEPTYDPETGLPAEGATHVLICGEQGSRVQLIKEVVVEGGAQPLEAMDSSVLTRLAELQCFVALIGFTDCPAANSPALKDVRALVNSGLIVMCYADHARTWPLRGRCNVLLAGAFTLFDSAVPEFSQDLNRALTEVLRLQRGRRDNEARRKSEMKKLGVVGESRMMRSIFRWVEKASALSDLPALITGETGTGKELIVNAIHRLDHKRSTGPLVALNCGAITAGVAESELFGHRRGAFTGADRHRKGLIRAADGGVLFLDEIGDLDCALQSKLLRVLQENRVLGVGEDRELPVNVRVIAATNRNLEGMVERGAFRDDLFHRLNILSVHIPALRQRPADLKPLVQHFVEKHRTLRNGTRLPVEPEFIEALAQLELPGNAREVENIVRRALVNKITDSPLGLADLAPEVLQKIAEQKVESQLPDESAGTDNEPERSPFLTAGTDYDASLFKLLQLNQGSLARTLQECERVLIAGALECSHGKQSSAAKLLGITPRSVYNKLRKHGLR
jgi:transcriptional regulator with GAF, ATPase, and Fis domain